MWGFPLQAFLGCWYNEKVDVYAWSHVVAEMLSLDVVSENITYWVPCMLQLPVAPPRAPFVSYRITAVYYHGKKLLL